MSYYANLLLSGLYAALFMAAIFTALRSDRRAGWLAMAIGLLALMLARALNAEEILREQLRSGIFDAETYRDRRTLQNAVLGVGIIALIGIIGVSFAWPWWKRLSPLMLAAWGLAGIFVLSLLRVLSVHAIDRLLYFAIGPVRFHWIAELTGIALVAFAAFQAKREMRRAAESRPHDEMRTRQRRRHRSK